MAGTDRPRLTVEDRPVAARTVAAGTAGGVVATGVMSVVMLAAGRLGLMGEYPPERIGRRGLRRAGFGPIRAEQLDGPAGAVLHVAFGGLLGAAFAAAAVPLARRLGRRVAGGRRPATSIVLPAAGVAFGSAVWVASYWGWVPWLGLLPPPDRDRLDRQLAMLAAHWVFGASLGASLAWLMPAPDA